MRSAVYILSRAWLGLVLLGIGLLTGLLPSIIAAFVATTLGLLAHNLFVHKTTSLWLRNAFRMLAIGSALGVVAGLAGPSGPFAAKLTAEPVATESTAPVPVPEPTPEPPPDPEAVRAARTKQIATSLADAQRFAANKQLCESSWAIKSVWDVLKTLTPADAEYARAKAVTPTLERCRLKLEKSLNQEAIDLQRQDRMHYRERIDRAMLEDGYDVEVSVTGTNKDRIVLTHVFFGNRAILYRLLKDGTFIEGLEQAGFKRLVFRDGFDTSFTYDLTPTPPDNRGFRVLDKIGLGAPLQL